MPNEFQLMIALAWIGTAWMWIFLAWVAFSGDWLFALVLFSILTPLSVILVQRTKKDWNLDI